MRDTGKIFAKVVPSARFANDWVAERAHALLSNGLQESKVLQRDYPKLRLVREVPLGFEAGAAADPQLFTREYGVSDFILCVGRIESRKNQLMLLKAMEDSELPIVFAGGGFSYQPNMSRPCVPLEEKAKPWSSGVLRLSSWQALMQRAVFMHFLVGMSFRDLFPLKLLRLERMSW